MIKPIDTTHDYSSKELTLHYYFDKTVKQSAYEMYEDDGRYRQAIDAQKYELLNFEAIQSENSLDQLVITLKRKKGNYSTMPDKRRIKLLIHNWSLVPEAIRFNSEQLDEKNWQYDQENRVLGIAVEWDHQSSEITIQSNK